MNEDERWDMLEDRTRMAEALIEGGVPCSVCGRVFKAGDRIGLIGGYHEGHFYRASVEELQSEQAGD